MNKMTDYVVEFVEPINPFQKDPFRVVRKSAYIKEKWHESMKDYLREKQIKAIDLNRTILFPKGRDTRV